ncbi:MAG: adenylate/guanylate cyclase domain-containing protein [Thermoleophilaceae bacterium]|nr:adenylate/guanylate cyclase domain-containing protein [Thermoleophilaceae bacterium]
MPSLLGRSYRRLGSGYFWLYAAFEVVSALIVCLATVGMFSLYTEMSTAEFLRVTAFSEACAAVAITYLMVRTSGEVRPLTGWLDDGAPDKGVAEAWQVAVSLPRRLVVTHGWQSSLIVGLPVSMFVTLEFGLPAYTAIIVFAGVVVAVAYVGVLHFFLSEQFLRPVVEDLAARLPPDFSAAGFGVPLRWKFLGALPVINIVTGVVVSGLSTTGSASLNDLGLDVVVAVLVAFTVSLELTILMMKSVLHPVDDLLRATEAVKRGNLETRVAMTSGDELGELAGSFNRMVRGLSEREVLRQALGNYVDPAVADRVLAEGALLEGQEREVSAMFVDIRDFTPLAERSSARETVTFLSDFFEVVVPLVLEHGGHVNKFIGDGLLAVFGAPERVPDHADRALAAADAIALAVDQRFGGDVRVGIGINSGPVVVGSVGGGGRLEFAVIGDAVNISARAERATRDTGDVILITESTRALLSRPRTELRPRGEIDLKGISDPVPLYALIPTVDERLTRSTPPLVADA